jgi:hypothetical protein
LLDVIDILAKLLDVCPVLGGDPHRKGEVALERFHSLGQRSELRPHLGKAVAQIPFFLRNTGLNVS